MMIGNVVYMIGYIHVANVPGRHEPGTGEINYSCVASELQSVVYAGIVRLEAYPAETDEAAIEAFRSVFAG